MPGLPPVDLGLLEWVRPEIDASLRKAVTLIDQYERESDVTALRKALTHIHEIKGNLKVVELDTAAQLTEEMEALVDQALSAEPVKVNGSVNGVGPSVRTGVAGLSHFLMQLSRGGVPTPLRLMPAINQLRSARQVEMLPEYEFFTPDLDVSPPLDEGDQAPYTTTPSATTGIPPKLRDHFQSALLRCITNPEEDGPKTIMAGLLNGLKRNTKIPSLKRLWWVASAFVHSLEGKGEISISEKSLLGRLDRPLRTLVEQGEQTLVLEPGEDLMREMLYWIAKSDSQKLQVLQVNEAFALDVWMGRVTSQDQKAPVDLNQRSKALEAFHIESEADIRSAQKELAAYFAPDGDEPETLERLIELLEKLVSHSGDEALAPLRELIWELRLTAQKLAGGWEIDKQKLSLQMASALLFIQDSHEQKYLIGDEWPAQASAISRGLEALREQTTADAKDVLTENRESESSYAHIQRTAAREMREALNKVEEGLEQYASAPAQNLAISMSDRQLEDVRGVLRILNHQDAARLAGQTEQAFTDLGQGSLKAAPRLLDALAVSVGTLQEYINGLEQGHPQAEELIARAETDLHNAIESNPNDIAFTGAAGEQTELAESAMGQTAKAEIPAAEVLERESFEKTKETSIPASTESAPFIPAPGQAQQQTTKQAAPLTPRVDLATQFEMWLLRPGDANALSQFRQQLKTAADSASGADNQQMTKRILIEMGTLVDAVALNPESITDSVKQTLRSAVGRVMLASNGQTSNAQAQTSVLSPTSRPVSALPLEPETAADTLSMSDHLKSSEKSRPVIPVESVSPPRQQQEQELVRDFSSETVPETFEPEATELLGRITLLRKQWWSDPTNSSVLEDLQRAFHTLKGSARVAGDETIGGLAECCDSLLVPITNYEAAPFADIHDFVGRAHRQLHTLIENPQSREHFDLGAWQAYAATLADAMAVADDKEKKNETDDYEPQAELEAVEQSVSEPVATQLNQHSAHSPESSQEVEQPAEIEPAEAQQNRELNKLFSEEARDILSRIATHLSDWRQGDHDESDVNPTVKRLQREFHTLKGGARVIANESIASISESAERVLAKSIASENHSALKQVWPILNNAHTNLIYLINGVENEDTGLVLSRLAELEARLGRLDEGGVDKNSMDGALANSVSDFSRFSENENVGANTDYIATSAVTQGQQPVAGQQRVLLVNKPLSEPKKPEAKASVSISPDDGKQTVRIETDELDNLVNYASEVGISRNQLERQVSMVKDTIRELNSSVGQFRQQLKKLEIEVQSPTTGQVSGGASADVEPFDMHKLEQTARMQNLSSELSHSLNNLLKIQDGLEEHTEKVHDTLRRQDHIHEDLQTRLRGTRMVDFSTYQPRFKHLVRQVAKTCEKTVELEFTDSQVLADRKMLAQALPVIEEMMRIMIGHGFSAGKIEEKENQENELDVLALSARQNDNELRISLSVNGSGLTVDSLAELVQPSNADTTSLGVQALLRFILSQPVVDMGGDGTHTSVNDVLSNIGGRLQLDENVQALDQLTLSLPVTLAETRVLEVFAGQEGYAIPARLIDEIEYRQSSELPTLENDVTGLWEYEGRQIPFIDVSRALNVTDMEPRSEQVPIVLIKAGINNIAVCLSGVGSTKDTAIKSLGSLYESLPAFSHGAVMGDGRVLLVIDVVDLYQSLLGDSSIGMPGSAKTRL